MNLISQKHTRAFTLIEILMGLTISTLILGAASGIFVMILHGWERGNRNYRMAQAARSTCDLLERHLRAAVGPAAGQAFIFSGEDLTAEGVHGQRLTFISSAALRLSVEKPPVTQQKMEFVCDPLDGQGLVLRATIPEARETMKSGESEKKAEESRSRPGNRSNAGQGRGGTPDRGNNSGNKNASASSIATELELEEGIVAENELIAEVTVCPSVRAFKVVYFDGSEWLSDWTETRLPRAIEYSLTLVDEEAESAQPASPDRRTGSPGTDGRDSQNAQQAEPALLRVSRLIVLPMAVE